MSIRIMCAIHSKVELEVRTGLNDILLVDPCPECISEAFNEGYDNNNGYDEGYDAGYDAGHERGMDVGRGDD